MKIFRGISFSLNKFLGISYIKSKIARTIGIPTTKTGVERKIGSYFLRFFISLAILMFLGVIGIFTNIFDWYGKQD